MVNNEKYRNIGFTLLFAGFLIIIVSIILFILLNLVEMNRVEAGAGGCIILLFIPICFVQGTPGALPFILLITIAIAIIVIVLTLLFSLIHFIIYRKSYIPTRIHK